MNDTIKVDVGATRMIAHRGLSGLERENTCAAFVAAGNRAAYFGIETDVHRTADGRYVVIHDADTGRVAGVSVNVEESDFAAVRSVILTDTDGETRRADLRVPTLEEYVSICKRYGKTGVLELKQLFTGRQLGDIIDIIRAQDYLESIIFISFIAEDLLRLRKLLPKQPAQLLIGEWKEEYYDFLTENRIDLDMWYGGLNGEIPDRLHSAGLKVNVYTCDSADDAVKLAGMGADYITTNILE